MPHHEDMPYVELRGLYREVSIQELRSAGLALGARQGTIITRPFKILSALHAEVERISDAFVRQARWERSANYVGNIVWEDGTISGVVQTHVSDS